MFDPDAHMPPVNRRLVYLEACMIAGIRLARERQVNVRVIPTGVAIAESVELAQEIFNRVFRKVSMPSSQADMSSISQRTHLRRTPKKNIAPGCPTSDFLGLPRHFLSPNLEPFGRKASFSTATPVLAN